jgi:hypothetical protein
MRKVALISVLVWVLTSFINYSDKLENALKEAGENRAELEKILDFYKSTPKDSLKYKAAVFLIENLPYRYYCKSIPEYEKAFDSINSYPVLSNRDGIFKKIFMAIPKNKTFDISELNPDIQMISSQFLIHNIDLAFMAWNKIPNENKASFDEFCQYILPYKTANEPFEEGVREKLYKKYSWVHKNLEAGASLQTVVDSVAADLNFRVINDIYKYYPQTLSISQVEKARVGVCADGINYLVNVFRALGIVSAMDMTPHWGNHPTLGHTWLYVKYGNKEYSTDVRGRINLKTLFKEESIPKIYRESYLFKEQNLYHSLLDDATIDYISAVSISIPNLFKIPNSQAALCVFDRKNEWSPVAAGNYENDNYNFNNIGSQVLYMAGSQEENDFVPANYPFYINKEKKPHFFKPKQTTINDVILTRKCRLSSARNRKSVLELMSSLNGCLFQGANKADFSDAVTLYQITNFHSNHLKKVVLKTNKKFQYVRFYSNGKKTSLSRLFFYDDNGEQLKGDVIQENIKNFKWEYSAFDKDPLTYTSGENFSLGFALSKATIISSIKFQVQNDMNHINIGNEYELFYWDKQWKSLGIKVAKDTLLQYAKVPENALFWLKNNTGGKEEQVFIIDKNKRQHWPGSDNY